MAFVYRKYIGELDRDYPSLGLKPFPGKTYEIDEDTAPDDDRWVDGHEDDVERAEPEPDPDPDPDPTDNTQGA